MPVISAVVSCLATGSAKKPFTWKLPSRGRGLPAPAFSAESAQQLRQCGDIVRGQMHFWNAFWTIPMGTHGERPGTLPGMAFKRNGFNNINAASGATGGGMSTNLYAGGVFELEPDEALIIENRIKRQPHYIGFQLGNLWGDRWSMPVVSAVSTVNRQVDADGIFGWSWPIATPGCLTGSIPVACVKVS